MQCKNHTERNATNTCNQCGTWLCDECTVDIQGRLFCRGCLDKLSSPHTSSCAPPKMPRRIDGALLCLLSILPPGTNLMYMGLMKRGLVTMCGFFLLIFMSATSGHPLGLIFGLSIPILILTSIFDGFNTRRRINAGEHVPDDIGDTLGGLFRNKTVATVVLAVLAIAFLGNIIGLTISIISRFMPLLIIGLLLYLVLKRKDKK